LHRRTWSDLISKYGVACPLPNLLDHLAMPASPCLENPNMVTHSLRLARA
jgi:hypothetical protein